MKTLLAPYHAFLERKQLAGEAAGTLAKHRRIIRNFLRQLETHFGLAQVGSVTEEHIIWWIRLLQATPSRHTGLPRKPIGIATEIKSVRSFCEYAVGRGEMAARVLGPLREYRTPHWLPRATPPHGRIRKFLHSLPTDTPRGFMHRTMAEILYTTGMRPCELLAIDIGDVDLEDGVVRVIGKGKRERVVPLGRTARHFLEGYLTAVRPQLLRDPSLKALWINTWQRRLEYRSLFRAIGKLSRSRQEAVPFTAYTFRHGCATEMVRSGANLWAVKELLGHNDLEMLKYYVHLSIADLRKTHARCHPRDNGFAAPQ